MWPLLSILVNQTGFNLVLPRFALGGLGLSSLDVLVGSVLGELVASAAGSALEAPVWSEQPTSAAVSALEAPAWSERPATSAAGSALEAPVWSGQQTSAEGSTLEAPVWFCLKKDSIFGCFIRP